MYRMAWKIINMFRLVYVFDPYQVAGYEHRTLKIIATWRTRRDGSWSGLDYWYTPDGM
jgi:hypothetical protein